MADKDQMEAILNITQGKPMTAAEALNAKLGQSLDLQRQSIKDTQSALKKYKGPKKKDMSALFAMGDMLSGGQTNYSGIYQHMKPKDTTREELALKGLLQRQQQALTDDEIKLLSKMGGGGSSALASNLTKGQIKADQEFGKEYTKFFAEGGIADADKGLEQLREVSGKLESSDSLTGPAIGSMPNWFRRRFFQDSAATQQAVEEVVQRNLRLILGAQFTEKEGARLIERAYDPAMSESENKKRVDRLIKSIEGARDSKLKAGQHFEKHGTLKGYKGAVGMTADEALSVMDGKKKKPSGDGKKLKMSFDEWKKSKGY